MRGGGDCRGLAIGVSLTTIAPRMYAINDWFDDMTVVAQSAWWLFAAVTIRGAG